MKLATPLFLFIFALSATVVGAESPDNPPDESIDPVVAAMKEFRQRGLDVFPMTMGKAAETLVDGSTGRPVESPWAFPGRGIEDPMLMGAAGFGPVVMDVHELYAKPHALTRIERTVAVSVADEGTTPSEQQMTEQHFAFVKAALARRGGADKWLVEVDGGVDDSHAAATWEAGLRDRFEEIIARTGRLTQRMPEDPVIVDDAGPAFDIVGAGSREWLHAEGTEEWHVSYGPGLHIVEGDGAAAWIVRNLKPGRWAVWLHIDGGPELTDQADLSFFAQGSLRADVSWRVDMSEERHGFIRLGDWIAATSRPLRVELHSVDGQPAIADAILFEPLEFYSPIDRQADIVMEKLLEQDDVTPTPSAAQEAE